MSVKVKDKGTVIRLRWLFSKVDLPKREISRFYSLDTYAGNPTITYYFGHPSASTDRVVIEAWGERYLIYTNNGPNLLSYLEEKVGQAYG